MQTQNAEKYVIPFIQERFAIKSGMRIMEIGAGEGGVLKAFTDMGCTGLAVELDPHRVEDGKNFLKEEISEGKIKFITSDIYDTDSDQMDGKFDLVILKDVIEHIHDQAKLILRMHEFIKPDGMIFFGFPPWYMPYGGHQQMGVKKLSRIPWLHLLPMFAYKGMMRLFGEPKVNIEMLAEVKETGISIERFEKILLQTGWKIILKRNYLINPIYEWKFGLRPRQQWSMVSHILFFRNFITTCVYYLVKPVKE